MHFHHTHEAIISAFATIPANVKQSVLLSGNWKGNYAVAAIVIDGIQPPAEVHMHAADVWIVIRGNPMFIVGGTLEQPSEVRDGEFVSNGIVSGQELKAKPGDVIDVPAGVPHQVNARNQRAEFLIIKIPT
jgi:mannose-6-phosphate isomerase-like protein (cupin superfamily)